jgi:hypothetical protein
MKKVVGIFAAMLGLGGLMVGLIRAVAISRADEYRNDRLT